MSITSEQVGDIVSYRNENNECVSSCHESKQEVHEALIYG